MLIPKALNSISKVYKIKILKYDKHLNDSEEHIQASFRETCKQSLSKKVIKAILLTNFEFFQYNSLYLKILRYFDRYGTKPEMEFTTQNAEHHAEFTTPTITSVARARSAKYVTLNEWKF